MKPPKSPYFINKTPKNPITKLRRAEKND